MPSFGLQGADGRRGIKELLKRIDTDSLSGELRQKMREETSLQKRLKYAKRLKVVRPSASPATNRNG